ncbi:hypothetical protein RhiirA4_432045 [Rhizophagus irregularis]|uniref:Uncharacterized protein n=1 Tax=Rhizophagus irregularis TaxID=588596 RepID=A0A2I1HSE2_9GLOM|nr:hypothetical protein RhiirA4_432045 [Rhizophagus irregularis]
MRSKVFIEGCLKRNWFRSYIQLKIGRLVSGNIGFEGSSTKGFEESSSEEFKGSDPEEFEESIESKESLIIFITFHMGGQLLMMLIVGGRDGGGRSVRFLLFLLLYIL